MFSSDSDEWETPQKLFNKLDEEFHFTLDSCATALNHKCDNYFTKEQNGLEQPWEGVVFCNPPYSRKSNTNPGQEAWVKKCYKESLKGSTVVLLIPARTDTKMFHDYILGKAEIRFIRGRVKFIDSNKIIKESAPFPSMVVIYRNNKDKNINNFNKIIGMEIK